MTYGHCGKALRVNLTTGSITTEELSETFLRRYVGGWGFIAYYLLKELAPGNSVFGSLPLSTLTWAEHGDSIWQRCPFPHPGQVLIATRGSPARSMTRRSAHVHKQKGGRQ